MFKNNSFKENIKIYDVKPLDKAQKSTLTFFDSFELQKKRPYLLKLLFCITTNKLKEYLPKSCLPIIVKHVLFDLANVTKNFIQERI